jgi:photosystem II stability/assembly factor-like uncharacterized protein
MKKLMKLFMAILFIISYASTDAQWFIQNAPMQNCVLYDVFSLNQNIAIAVGYNSSNYQGIIIKTTDAGENWLIIPHDSASVFSSVYFINSDTGWVIGSVSFGWGWWGYGVSLKTTDAGNSWTCDTVGSIGLRSVYFADQNNGWIVGGYVDDGYNGLMYRTTDGGINWIFQYYYGYIFSSVHFVNKDTGWVAAWSGEASILKTTDGGANWVAKLDTGFYALSSIYFINEFTGLAAGGKWNGSSYQGVILQTTNSGDTWIEQQIGVANYLNDVYFINSNIGWAVGSEGIILKTTNVGNNWLSQESGTNNDLTSVHFVNENTGWAVGGNGTILKTTNGGDPVPVELTTFTVTIQNDFVDLNWTTMTETNNQGFEVQRSFGNSEFITIGFVEGNGTTTEEHHYTFIDEDVSGFLRYKLKQVDFDGSYEYSDIVEVEVLGNVSYELAQNYPNPFNPITNISYTLPTESQVKVSIYNPLGELVETIVNEKQSAGKYDAVWNAGSYPSGVYIYTLDAVGINGSEQKKLSKKMILLR